MSRWTHTLDLYDLDEALAARSLTPSAYAQEAAARLTALGPVGPDLSTAEEGRFNMIDGLELLSEDSDLHYDDLVTLVERLRDWGDELLSGDPVYGRKLCRIGSGL